MYLCIYLFIYLFKYIYFLIYIPLPGGPFDVGGALSKPYAQEQI